MGVASGMPADPDLLPILRKHIADDSPWQVTAIGRSEIWALHRRAAERRPPAHRRGRHLLPAHGERCRGNGDLVESLVAMAREVGRSIASPAEARALLHLPPGADA